MSQTNPEPEPNMSATKTRNMLVKKFGCKPRKNYGESNPYLSFQSMQAEARTENLPCIKEGLKADGWVASDDGTKFTKDRDSIRFWIPKDWPYVAFADITGPKKAKPLTIPYYD